MNMHTHEILEEIATAAARKAVKETLLTIGINADDPIAFQQRMDFLRKLEGIGDSARRTVVKTTVGVAVTALLGLIGYALFPHLK